MKQTPVPQQLLIDCMGPQVDVAGCWRFTQPVHFRYHVLFHHLILVERGGVLAKTPQGNFEARNGDLLCLRPARWSEYRTLPDTITYQAQVAFAAPPFDRTTPQLPGLGLLPVLIRLGTGFEPVRQAFETICKELPKPGMRAQVRVKTAVYQMLGEIVNALTGEEDERLLPDPWDQVRAKLTAFDGSKPDIAGLARGMGVTPQHFRRIFKQRFGMTAQQFQLAARLHEAIRRLREGKEPVKAIAYEMGFAGGKALTRSIQKHLGLTPRQIRRNPEELPPLSQAMLEPFALNRHLHRVGESLENVMERYAPQETRLG